MVFFQPVASGGRRWPKEKCESNMNAHMLKCLRSSVNASKRSPLSASLLRPGARVLTESRSSAHAWRNKHLFALVGWALRGACAFGVGRARNPLRFTRACGRAASIGVMIRHKNHRLVVAGLSGRVVFFLAAVDAIGVGHTVRAPGIQPPRRDCLPQRFNTHFCDV